MGGLVERLPVSMANASRPSALLSLVHTMTLHAPVTPRLADYEPLLPAVLRCLAAGIKWVPTPAAKAASSEGADSDAAGSDAQAPSMTSGAIEGVASGTFVGSGPGDRVVLTLLEIVGNLLQTTTPRRERELSDSAALPSLLAPHTTVLLDQLCIRLGAKSSAAGHAARMKFLRRELAILLAVARYVAAVRVRLCVWLCVSVGTRGLIVLPPVPSALQSRPIAATEPPARTPPSASGW